MSSDSPGRRFRSALASERPLQIVGAVNAYTALLAGRAGFRAVYLSGAGVANACFGLPDLAVTTLTEVCEETRRITAAVDLPLLVDADTGWGNELMVARAVSALEQAGAAGCHLEDQVSAKRCGHRPGKALVDAGEMQARIRAAREGCSDDSFVVMARTDAAAREGVPAAIQRARRYVEAGADMIFAEALTTLDDYRRFTAQVPAPVLANITEFGRTPLFDLEELESAGVAMALYPLTAFRAMSRAAERVYGELRRAGTQAALLGELQTREELYDILNYHAQEARLDGSAEQE